MINKTLLVAALLVAFCAPAQAASLDVDITHLRPTKTVKVSVYKDEESWRTQRNPVTTRTVPASANSQTVRIDDLPPGSYAVRVEQAPNPGGLAEIPSFAQVRHGTSGRQSRSGLAPFERAVIPVGAEGARVTVHLFTATGF